MRESAKRIGRRLAGAALCLLLGLTCALPCAAAAEAADTVTVAYIDYKRFITEDGDGVWTGYGADYLNRIAAYAGWCYEFVDMDWPTAYEAVRAGTVDFYCVARQTEERQADFDFSLYPICNEEMNLYTLPGSGLYYEDFAAFDGLRIGMLEGSGEIDDFRQYAEQNGFSYELVEYPMNEAAVEALHAGAVDAVALVNYSVEDGLKLVGNFGVSPAYLMSADDSAYMKAFSAAQERLFFDDPTFTQELEQTYYGEARQYDGLLLTREEAEYIADAGPLTVALSADMAPIEYYDEEAGAFRGVTVDLYERISALTGLQFRFVRREDAPQLHAQMEDGGVQLVGAMARSAAVEEALRLVQTDAFFENSFSLVARDISGLTADSVAAIPAGYPQFADAAARDGYTNTRSCASFDDCVRAVYSGEADLTYVISLCTGYLLDHVQYSELRRMECVGTDYGVCLGVSEACDARLLPILDKCLAAIPSREINESVVANTAAAKPVQTVRDFATKNGVILLAAGVAFVGLLAFAILRAQRERQQRILNRELRQHHDFLQHLYDTLPCGIFQYRYEAPHRILNYNAACARIYGYEDGAFPVLGEVPDAVVEAGTEAAFQEKFDLCEKTGPTMYIWPVTRSDGSQAYTESVMDLVETGDGKVFQEVILDVTDRVRREQETEKRYAQELRRRGKRDEGLLYTACFDVTEQLLTETDIDVPGIRAGMSVAEFVEGLWFELEDLQSAEAMEDFRTRFTNERLERAYEDGRYEQSFDLCRRKNGQIQWLRSDLALRYNPSTGHLMCFDYIWDITDEHVANEILRRVAFADCDGFMSVYTATGRCLQYKIGEGDGLSRTETVYGRTDAVRRMAERMAPADAEAFLCATELSVVAERLEADALYPVYATLLDESGARQDKALIYFYTNRYSGVLAVTITDVTEVRASEVRHAQLLSDALAAAEKADAAKSRFLSRVSHEMRTPLNAIIGFIELARDADAEKTAACLASSNLAAKQLLSVINDVLDMSSIESGKLKISNTSFNFRHVIASITNIYGAQCKQKGVAFETRITAPLDDWLVGDELRVNQILMNLLGNAVKFTSEGHIWLTISQTAADGDKLFLRFEVSDTGCGMSDEMKERLFKPFEQESAATARKYGGSGLGLSIVKSLVGMMGGSVRVESAAGEGSTFTVDLPFCKSDVGLAGLPPQKVETLRILVVDDEASEREYMDLVLRRMGVRFTSVTGGGEALAALERAEAENDLYNVCLIDWRMPEMNGFDTTRRIREKYGKDVVVIVVSAYDFQQAGDRAREAGANLFLSKPIFQSSLFDLFMTLTGGRIAKPKDEPPAWDFAGKRVLLAEDNALNQIVAKGYLAKYNVVVELAENGQIAVDKFLAASPGFYDAILMDIQMPVMDGFEATKRIRASAHPEAKTIPIIAQTADAFNEDITKALSAGMDAHVAKPIEPDVLAKALYRAFQKTVAGK